LIAGIGGIEDELAGLQVVAMGLGAVGADGVDRANPPGAEAVMF
jgi:hypothetical protein